MENTTPYNTETSKEGSSLTEGKILRRNIDHPGIPFGSDEPSKVGKGVEIAKKALGAFHARTSCPAKEEAPSPINGGQEARFVPPENKNFSLPKGHEQPKTARFFCEVSQLSNFLRRS